MPGVAGEMGIPVDGDFSQAVEPPSYTTYKRGQAFAPDWLVTRHTIDFARDYPGFQAPNGACSIDLDGTPGAGAIVHGKFATKPGVNYTVTFEFSGNGATGPPSGQAHPRRSRGTVSRRYVARERRSRRVAR